MKSLSLRTCTDVTRNTIFFMCNLSKAKQTLAKKNTGHCLTYLYKTMCEIWWVCNIVQFWPKIPHALFPLSLPIIITDLKMILQIYQVTNLKNGSVTLWPYCHSGIQFRVIYFMHLKVGHSLLKGLLFRHKHQSIMQHLNEQQQIM